MTDKRTAASKYRLLDKLRKALDLEPPEDHPLGIVAQGGYVTPLATHTTFDSSSIISHSWGASSFTSEEVDELREMLEWYRKMKTP